MDLLPYFFHLEILLLRKESRMSNKEIIKLLKQQLQQQKEQLQQQQIQQQQMQNEETRNERKAFLDALQQFGLTLATSEASPASAAAIPSFSAFDPASELWTDYYLRFQTFVGAHYVPEDKRSQIFLTNQTNVVYKLLLNLATQQQPPVDISKLTMDDIVKCMSEQYDQKCFAPRERYKFWSDLKRKPGESIHDLEARIREDAVTCDFPSIKDPLDEALCTRFVCSVNNETVIKALFKEQTNELTFSKAVQIALETEDTAKVAKETMHISQPNVFAPINVVKRSKFNFAAKPHSSQRPNRDEHKSTITSCVRYGMSVGAQNSLRGRNHLCPKNFATITKTRCITCCDNLVPIYLTYICTGVYF